MWDARNRYSLLLVLSVIALLLYPFALGIGILDPYRSGFASVSFIVALALLSLWAMRRNCCCCRWPSRWRCWAGAWVGTNPPTCGIT